MDGRKRQRRLTELTSVYLTPTEKQMLQSLQYTLGAGGIPIPKATVLRIALLELHGKMVPRKAKQVRGAA